MNVNVFKSSLLQNDVYRNTISINIYGKRKLSSFQNKNLVQPVKFFRTDGSLIQVFQQQ